VLIADKQGIECSKARRRGSLDHPARCLARICHVRMIARQRDPDSHRVARGYRLILWGQGFATEAVRRVLDYSRDVLGLSCVISAIHPQNARSRRVAERCGARAAGQMEVVGLTWDRWMYPLATGGATQLATARATY
jgi:Acetyltransferase (GNAT) domain